MAHHEMNTLMTTPEMIWELVAKPIRIAAASVGNALVAMAENSSQMQAARRIAEMSDEELAALGVTRAEAVQRALGRYV